MIDTPLAVGFSAGMLAAFNPCGFALLPAYLSFFIGPQNGSVRRAAGAAQALRVGAAVTTGFVVIFGVAGFAATGMSLSVQRYAPWATLVIGLALVPLGLAVVAGRSPKWSLPRLQRAGSGRGEGSMVLFGVSYATVSLSCTLPVFLAAVSTTFREDDLTTGLAVFLAYATGMGLVLTGLAVAMALARQSMVRRLRRVLPFVERASGVLLAAAGAYVAWYGWFEVRLAAGAAATAGPIDAAGRLSGQISTWINNVGALRLGISVVALTAVVLLREPRHRRHAMGRGGGDQSAVLDADNRAAGTAASVSATDDAVDVYWRPGCFVCWRVRWDLRRLGVPTRWHNIWTDEAACRLVRRIAEGMETVPTIVVRDEALVAPSRKVLAATLRSRVPHLVGQESLGARFKAIHAGNRGDVEGGFRE